VVKYRVIRDERSIFWDVIVLVTVKDNVHINMRQTLYVDRQTAV